MKGNHPKRRKDKYNPYTIYELDHKYYIEFQDGQLQKHRMEISSDLFGLFDSFELEDLHYLNIVDRHLEQSELYESTFERRSQKIRESAEDEAIKNMTYQQLYYAIYALPGTQRRRLLMYYFVGLTLEEIAEMENCSRQAISKSLVAAEKKMKEFFK